MAAVTSMNAPSYPPGKMKALRERFYILPATFELNALTTFTGIPLETIERRGRLRSRQAGIGFHGEWIFHRGDNLHGVKTWQPPRNAGKYYIYYLSRAFEAFERKESFIIFSLMDFAIECGLTDDEDYTLKRQFWDLVKWFRDVNVYIPEAGELYPLMDPDARAPSPDVIPGYLTEKAIAHALAVQRAYPVPVVVPKAVLADETTHAEDIPAAISIYSSMLAQGIYEGCSGDLFNFVRGFVYQDPDTPALTLSRALTDLTNMGVIDEWHVYQVRHVDAEDWEHKPGDAVEIAGPHFYGLTDFLHNFMLGIKLGVTLET